MSDGSHAALLAAELDMLVARAGLTIPPDRRADLLTVFADLRGEIARLDEKLAPELEPASVYRPAEARLAQDQLTEARLTERE